MKKKLLVKGPVRLKGEVRVGGAKNSAVAIIPAALLSEEPVIIRNIPDIKDVRLQLELVENVGGKVEYLAEGSIRIVPGTVNRTELDYAQAKRLRASYYFMGVLVGKLGKAVIPLPGGCDLGPRPIDQHLKGFSLQGVEYSLEGGKVYLNRGKDKDASIYLDIVSVGATINLMMSAVLRKGKTVIENAAKEPEVVDLANFLSAMGACVRGAGTDIIRIEGVEHLKGTDYTVIPDRIEAGSYLLGVAATGGEVKVCDVIPKHLEPVTAKLKEMGMEVKEEDDSISMVCADPSPVDIKTFPYPGFPTDLQPLAMAVLTRSPGMSVITENVFEGRFRHVEEFKKMGAKIRVEGRSALVEGVACLKGSPLRSLDLRADAALIFAALAAEGESVLYGTNHISRGYENMVEKLISLGADLSLMEES